MKRREGYNSTREGEKYAQWLVHQDCSSWWLCRTLRRAMALAMTMKYLMLMGMEKGSRVMIAIMESKVPHAFAAMPSVGSGYKKGERARRPPCALM